MKLAICAVAKQENEYISDWIKYHIDLGFTKIFIYDNNDSTYEDVSTRIADDYKEYVEIIPSHDQECYQHAKYRSFYNTHRGQFDWIAFIDLDEFITLGGEFSTLEELLKDKRFQNFDAIKMAWETYGDSGIIEGDVSIPIFERLTKVCKDNPAWNNRYQTKTIIRGDVEGATTTSTHFWKRVDGTPLPQCTSEGLESSEKIGIKHLNKNLYIRHYITKTLSEFIKYKFKRTDAVWGESRTGLDYFFTYNERTPEHDKYLKETGIL